MAFYDAYIRGRERRIADDTAKYEREQKVKADKFAEEKRAADLAAAEAAGKEETRKRLIDANRRFLTGFIGYTEKGGKPEEFIDRFRSVLPSIGMDEANAAEYLAPMMADPSIAKQYLAMLEDPDAANKPRGSTAKPFEAIGPDGKRVFLTETEPGVYKPIEGFAPPEEAPKPGKYDDPLDRAHKQAQIDALRRSNQPKPASGKGAPDPQQASRVDAILDEMRGNIEALRDQGGMVKTGGNVVDNLVAAASASPLGQAVGKATGDKNQSLRQQINDAKALLVREAATALGVTSQQLNTENEYKWFRDSLGDITGDADSAIAAIERLRGLIGSQQAASAATGGTTDGSTISLDDFLKE